MQSVSALLKRKMKLLISDWRQEMEKALSVDMKIGSLFAFMTLWKAVKRAKKVDFIIEIPKEISLGATFTLNFRERIFCHDCKIEKIIPA